MECNITRFLITAPPIHSLHGYLFNKYAWVWVNRTRAKHQSPHPEGRHSVGVREQIYLYSTPLWLEGKQEFQS